MHSLSTSPIHIQFCLYIRRKGGNALSKWLYIKQDALWNKNHTKRRKEKPFHPEKNTQKRKQPNSANKGHSVKYWSKQKSSVYTVRKWEKWMGVVAPANALFEEGLRLQRYSLAETWYKVERVECKRKKKTNYGSDKVTKNLVHNWNHLWNFPSRNIIVWGLHVLPLFTLSVVAISKWMNPFHSFPSNCQLWYFKR